MTEEVRGQEKLPLKQIWLICFNTVFVMAGLSIVSPVLPEIRQWQEASYALMGVFVAAFSVARTIIDIPAGFLTDRWGSGKISVFGLGLTALGSFFSATSPNFYILIVSRFIAGLGSGLAVTSLQTELLLLTPSSHRNRVMSWFMISRRVGSSMFPFAGGLIAAWGSWRAVFFLSCFLNVIGTGIALYQGRMKGGRVSGETGSLGKKRAGKHKFELFGGPEFILVLVLAFVIFMNRDGLERTVIPFYGSTLSLDSARIGLALSASAVVSILGIYLGGKAADRFGAKKTLFVGLASVLAANALFLGVNSYPTYLLTSLIFGLAAYNMGLPNVIAADMAGREKTGQAIGLVRFFNDLGSVLGPLILTAIIDYFGFHYAFYFSIGLLAVVLISEAIVHLRIMCYI